MNNKFKTLNDVPEIQDLVNFLNDEFDKAIEKITLIENKIIELEDISLKLSEKSELLDEDFIRLNTSIDNINKDLEKFPVFIDNYFKNMFEEIRSYENKLLNKMKKVDKEWEKIPKITRLMKYHANKNNLEKNYFQYQKIYNKIESIHKEFKKYDADIYYLNDKVCNIKLEKVIFSNLKKVNELNNLNSILKTEQNSDSLFNINNQINKDTKTLLNELKNSLIDKKLSLNNSLNIKGINHVDNEILLNELNGKSQEINKIINSSIISTIKGIKDCIKNKVLNNDINFNLNNGLINKTAATLIIAFSCTAGYSSFNDFYENINPDSKNKIEFVSSKISLLKNEISSNYIINQTNNFYENNSSMKKSFDNGIVDASLSFMGSILFNNDNEKIDFINNFSDFSLHVNGLKYSENIEKNIFNNSYKLSQISEQKQEITLIENQHVAIANKEKKIVNKKDQIIDIT